MACKTITIDGIAYELTPLWPVKDYEILSFKDPYGTVITWQGEDAHGGYNYKQWSEASLAFDYKIHSVKRLADNEIFTISDRIDDTNYGYANQIIHEFEIKESKILVRYWNGCCYLENIKKTKLMTTLTINQKTIEELTKMRSDINKLWPEHFKDMGFIPVAIAVSQLNGFSRIQKEIDRLIEILKDDPNDKTRTD